MANMFNTYTVNYIDHKIGAMRYYHFRNHLKIAVEDGKAEIRAIRNERKVKIMDIDYHQYRQEWDALSARCGHDASRIRYFMHYFMLKEAGMLKKFKDALIELGVPDGSEQMKFV
jgi:hypothetical protein